MLQNARCSKVVFYLLKGGQSRLPVGGDDAVIVRGCRVRDCVPSSSIKEGLRHVWSNRPLRLGQLNRLAIVVASNQPRVKDQSRTISSASYADLVIRFCNATFPSGDVGSALKEGGGLDSRDDGETERGSR
jgi:hypothetical protein